MNIQQFEEFERILLANPPEIVRSIGSVQNGKVCHCAIGQLGKAKGMTFEQLVIERDYDTLYPLLRREFGIALDDHIGVAENVTPQDVWRANDSVPEHDQFTPEYRARVVIAKVRQRLVDTGVL